MLAPLLVKLAKDVVFDALLKVLKELAKESDNPIDDQMVQYLEASKPAIMTAVSKVF
jgi:hypothetical protein